jgi:predicted alpha/beta hydrolase
MPKRFDRVTIPVAAAASTDDLWAPPASRDAFFSGYRSTKVACIDLKPHALGAQQIGHMGYFRKEIGATLWPEIFRWLSQHGLKMRS